MSIKEKVDNHPLVFFFSTLLLGFLSGIGAYQGILSIANLEVVTKGRVISREKVESEYISKLEHENTLSALEVKVKNEWEKEANKFVAKSEYQKLLESLGIEKSKNKYISFVSFDVERLVLPRDPWHIPEVELKVSIHDVISGKDWNHTAIVELEFPNKKPMKIAAKRGDKWDFSHEDRKFSLELTYVSDLGASATFRFKSI